MSDQKFNKQSKKRLGTCNDVIITVMEEAVLHSPVAFQISEGGISIDTLREKFKSNMTRVNPDKFIIHKKDKKEYRKEIYTAAANLVRRSGEYKKSRMVTVSCDKPELLAGHILGTAQRLKSEEKIDMCLRWRSSVDAGMDTAKFQFEIYTDEAD